MQSPDDVVAIPAYHADADNSLDAAVSDDGWRCTSVNLARTLPAWSKRLTDRSTATISRRVIARKTPRPARY